MDALSLLRTMGALGVVLGLLGGALWVVRRYNIALPGRVALGRGRRLELVERVTLDGKRSLALIRRDGCEHLILIGPDGQMVVESGILPMEAPVTAEAAPAALAVAPVDPVPAAASPSEPDLRKALTLLLDHLQARRDSSASAPKSPATPPVPPPAPAPQRSVGALLEYLAEHHGANVVA